MIRNHWHAPIVPNLAIPGFLKCDSWCLCLCAVLLGFLNTNKHTSVVENTSGSMHRYAYYLFSECDWRTKPLQQWFLLKAASSQVGTNQQMPTEIYAHIPLIIFHMYIWKKVVRLLIYHWSCFGWCLFPRLGYGDCQPHLMCLRFAFSLRRPCKLRVLIRRWLNNKHLKDLHQRSYMRMVNRGKSNSIQVSKNKPLCGTVCGINSTTVYPHDPPLYQSLESI